MLHLGLDLSRRRVDVCLISSKGELVEDFRAPADRDGLYGLTRRVAVYDESARGVVEPMNGGRFVHDELVRYGWEVLVADAQWVKGLAPLACKTECAARRPVVSPAQPEELEGRFLGPMAYPDPKGERDNSMLGKRRSGPDAGGEASRDPRDMAKAGLPDSQSPEDAMHRPPERHPRPAPRPATAWSVGRRNLRGVERCPVRAIKEMSGTPTSRSDVRQGRTRDQPSGREPQGDGVPVVVVGVATHQGGRESRPQGEGAQVAGYPLTGRYA